MKLIYYNSVHT